MIFPPLGSDKPYVARGRLKTAIIVAEFLWRRGTNRLSGEEGSARITRDGNTQYTASSRVSIPMYTSGGRRGAAGRGRASFVECGLILMGTDDKQRKQASSLPGEICLLLAGVQQ